MPWLQTCPPSGAHLRFSLRSTARRRAVGGHLAYQSKQAPLGLQATPKGASGREAEAVGGTCDTR